MTKNNLTIALAADHAGFNLKNHNKEFLRTEGYNVVDLGTNTGDRVD